MSNVLLALGGVLICLSVIGLLILAVWHSMPESVTIDEDELRKAFAAWKADRRAAIDEAKRAKA